MKPPLTTGKRELLLALIIDREESDLGILEYSQGEASEYYKSLANLPDSELIRMAAEIMEDEA